jgi:hypothetical protein
VERLLDRRGVKGKRLEYADLSGRAVLAEAKGEAREAAELYVEAAERWRDYGHVVEEGYALLGLGRCQLALGDPAGAAAVADARAIFTRLGAAPLVREADALLAEATPSASAS